LWPSGKTPLSAGITICGKGEALASDGAFAFGAPAAFAASAALVFAAAAGAALFKAGFDVAAGLPVVV